MTPDDLKQAQSTDPIIGLKSEAIHNKNYWKVEIEVRYKF